ncbi:hypothetical protein DFH11DRAFT_1606941 [Phellopilus nigrolimitatus]|nr:hypothetical protein DFH11DRAFT_1606941 [Phellopilus nigrolimitatus]
MCSVPVLNHCLMAITPATKVVSVSAEVNPEAGPSKLATSKKRPASVLLSDSEAPDTKSNTTFNMRTDAAAVDMHRKQRRKRRRKSSVTDVLGFNRTLQKVEKLPMSATSHTVRSKGKEPANALRGTSSSVNVVMADSDTSGEIASLRERAEQQAALLAVHKEFMKSLAPSLTCQICLDPMHRPYTLAPCGHTACYGCLVAWFRAPPQHIAQPPPQHLAHNFDGEDPTLLARGAPMLIRKEKTCPHCRAVIREAPVEAWGLKDIVAHLFASKGNLAKDVYPEHEPPEVCEPGLGQTSADVWRGVFRPGRTLDLRVAPSVDRNGRAEDNEDFERGGDRGFFDDEDGVHRCTACYHEIWDGICSSCGRLFPGLLDHAEDGDEDEDGGHWVDAQGFDDGGWMDQHEGFGGADGGLDLHEIVDAFARGARLIPRDGQDQDQDDDGYESSFIDDEDGGARIEEYHSAEDDGHSGSGSEEEGEDIHEQTRSRQSSPPRVARAGSALNHSGFVNTTIDLAGSDSESSESVANYRRARSSRVQILSDEEDGDSDIDYVAAARAPRVDRTIVVDSSDGEDNIQSRLVGQTDYEYDSRSFSSEGSISGDDSDRSSQHEGEFYVSGSGSSRYNDAFSDEEDGINWSD